MGILYLLIGTVFGAIITYLRMENKPLAESEALTNLKSTNRFLEKKIKTGEVNHQQLEAELKNTKEALHQRTNEFQRLETDIATIKSQLELQTNEDLNKEPTEPIRQFESEMVERSSEINHLTQQIDALTQEKSELASNIESLKAANQQVAGKVSQLEEELKQKVIKCNDLKQALSYEKEAHKKSRKQLHEQKASFEALGKKFNSDFEQMASKILDELETQRKN